MTAGPRTWSAGTLLSAGLSISLLLLLLLPIAALLTYVPPGDIVTVWADPGARSAISFTLLASGLALAISLLFGVPLGYLLARRRFPGRALVESAVALPVVVPHLVAGIALLILFQPHAPLGALAIRLGVPVVNTIWGVVLVMVYVSAPYTVLASQLAFRSVDPRLLEAAQCLGAAPSRVFSAVSLPIAARGIGAGGLLTWARSVSEIGGFLILAETIYPSPPYSGPVTNAVSVYIYQFFLIGNFRATVAVSSLFVLIAFGLFILVRVLERLGRLPWAKGELLP